MKQRKFGLCLLCFITETILVWFRNTRLFLRTGCLCCNHELMTSILIFIIRCMSSTVSCCVLQWITTNGSEEPATFTFSNFLRNAEQGHIPEDIISIWRFSVMNTQILLCKMGTLLKASEYEIWNFHFKFLYVPIQKRALARYSDLTQMHNSNTKYCTTKFKYLVTQIFVWRLYFTESNRNMSNKQGNK